MIKKKHFGKVVKGKFKPDNLKDFKFAFYTHEGQEVEVTVDKKQKERSNNQNSYYWGVVLALICETIGEQDADKVHESMRRKFLPIHYDNLLPDGSKSTTKLTTVEMEEYLSKIRQWASEFLNCYIPLPNEVDY